jgi:CPA2 family monovalent cation:H+ antiporter-2
MPHDTPLVSTIVAGLVLAFIFGTLANRFKMPPLVGYLVAGVAVGPFTPGFVADADLATELSEIGVILLMFGVGLHFSLKDLLSVRALAIPGAVVQIGGATLLGLGLATALGWSIGAGLIFGLALSVASTVVLLKALQERHMVESEKGRIAVGWLIVEDLAMVLALVLIPAVAGIFGVEGAAIHDPFIDFVERIVGPIGLVGVLAVTVVKLAAFVGFMLVVGRRLIPALLHYTAHTGSRELFRLAVLAIALGVAAGAAYLFGVSLALGAFFAGMILSESELSHRAAQETLPLRDAFSVLFFVAVGMLFDPTILLRDPLPVLATVLIIIVGKALLAFGIVIAFKRPVSTALTISASLAQIGEFSFILAALGVGLGILPPEARDLILAGAIISIVLNPVVFWGLDKLRPAIEARLGRHARAETEPRREPDLVSPQPAAAAVASGPTSDEDDRPERVPTTKTGHVVLIGYGRVGAVVGEALKAANRAFLVIEDGEDAANAARAAGAEVIAGNAASPEVLACANLTGAAALVVGIPNAFEAGQATEQGRKLNKTMLIVARAHSDDEESYLRNLGANIIIMGEREIGLGMAEIITRDQRSVAEIVAADAVEQALAPLAAMGAVAAVAPAVPMAPFAEMPSTTAEPLDVEPEAAEPEVVAASSATAADEIEAEPVAVEQGGDEQVTPPHPRRMPASTPGEAFATAPESFNPEVPPR